MGFLKKMSTSIKNPKKAASIVFNKVDEGAGKKIFGNTTGVVRSVSGRNKLDLSFDAELKKTNPELFHLKKHQILHLIQILYHNFLYYIYLFF